VQQCVGWMYADDVQSQLKVKETQVKALETQAAKLRDIDPDKEQQLSSRKVEVEDRFNQLLAPLIERRRKLDQFKRVQQVCSIDDTMLSIVVLCCYELLT